MVQDDMRNLGFRDLIQENQQQNVEKESIHQHQQTWREKNMNFYKNIFLDIFN